ncbi:tetratricopeptide repeat protein [uncultured Flavobacterium sp.]|uniref:ATP-binding protein n=1 Tax=uncultured Flavobacterium sp. TaxID=165435 RepID=UPI0030820BD6
MIPQRLRTPLYIIFTFLFFLSCQEQNSKITQHKNTKAEVQKTIAIADGLFNNNKLDSAFYYYNKAKFICNPISNADHYVASLNRMAEIQQIHADYAGSESTITEVLPYLKYAKKTPQIWNSYVIQSINYLNTYDYNNAILYNQKALDLKTEESLKLAAKNNIAVILMEEGKYNDALSIFLSLISNKDVINDTVFQGRALDNIGFCYFKTGDSVKALDFLNKSLQLRKKTNNPFDLGKSYMHFAKFYEKSNPTLAKKYMLLSYEKFNSINNTDERLSSLKLIITNSSDRELKKYSTIYVNLVDSVFEIRQKAKNQFAKIKYDSKKEKNENLKLNTHKVENELQLERQKNKNIISYIIIILSLSLILVLYFYLTSRGNREKIEATYKSETRIAKKLHDELANDIYHTMAFAESKNLSLAENKEQLLNNLDIIYLRTRDISKESSPIITSEKYILYLKEMISGFNTPHINLVLNGLESIPWNEIEKNKRVTIYRVLQELLVNMKKYSNANLVGITFKKTYNNVVITYTDNGKGIDLNRITFKNGLHNVENRILAIKGIIDIDSAPDKGFKVFIKFPI